MTASIEPLVECVPNFSDGQRQGTLDAIVRAVEAVEGVRLLDASRDPDHNRAVVTFAAPPHRVGEAAFQAVSEAAERIDLTRHAGVHPRMGATDVCPFIALEGVATAECVALARACGRRVGDELGIPVYFYGDAALAETRRRLPDVRRGGFERLRTLTEAELAPDAGPSSVHPTAGATAIGVRPFLIAFNVNLQTDDVSVARDIARRVRESSGGLPGIRALGFFLEEAGSAQVSLNVCDYERTGLIEVFREIERLALARGVAVRESELVGLAPRAALTPDIARAVRLAGFDPEKHTIEGVLSA